LFSPFSNDKNKVLISPFQAKVGKSYVLSEATRAVGAAGRMLIYYVNDWWLRARKWADTGLSTIHTVVRYGLEG
jgi:hypothetical protein